MKTKAPWMVAAVLIAAVAGCLGTPGHDDAILLQTVIQNLPQLVQGVAAGQNILSISGAYVVPSSGLPSSPAAQYWQVAVLNATATAVTVATMTPSSELSYSYPASPSMILATPPLPTNVTLSPHASLLNAQRLLVADHPSVAQEGTIISYHLTALGGVPVWTAGATLPNDTYVSATVNALTNAITSPVWMHQPMFPALALAEQALAEFNLTGPPRLLAAVGLERPPGSYEPLESRWGYAMTEIPPDTTLIDGQSPVWAFDFWIPNASLAQRVTVYGPAQVVVGEQNLLTPEENEEAATAVIPSGIMGSVEVVMTRDRANITNLRPVLMILQEHKFRDGVPLWDFVIPGPPERQYFYEDGYTSVDARTGEWVLPP